MVQVLPYNPTFAERIAPSITEAANTVAGRTVLEQNLGQLQNANNGRELATALVRLSASNPGIERSVGPLLETLLQSMQGATPTPGQQPNPSPSSPIQNYRPSNKPKIAGPESFPPGRTIVPKPRNLGPEFNEQPPEFNEQPSNVTYGALPYRPGILRQINTNELYTPEDFKNVIDESRKREIDPAGNINFMESHNKRVVKQGRVYNENQKIKQEQLSNQIALSNLIAKDIQSKLPPGGDPNLNALYAQWVQDELPNHTDIASAQTAVSDKIFNFDKTYREVTKSFPDNPAFGLTNVEATRIRKAAAPLFKKDPLAYRVLEKAMVDKGNSIFDAARTFNPLDQETKNVLNTITDYKGDVYPSSATFGAAGQRQEIVGAMAEANRNQEASIKDVAEKIGESWNPKTSLLNIYVELLHKGWFPGNILAIFDRLTDKYTSQQQVERAQLSTAPPVPANYLLK